MTRCVGYNSDKFPELGMSNLYLTIGAKKLGLKKNYSIESGETIYFSYKENDVWYVKARATIIEQLDASEKPWNDGNVYSRWSLKDVYEFPPFELNVVTDVNGSSKGRMLSWTNKLENTKEFAPSVNQLKTATNAIISSLHLHAR
ncbi:hypothetical protein [Lactiplantibacillus plantarum]|uniref:hypothetical protein n=1 Tax=Lactiplantibacillus plantarum TaxID=1590 RepID=UPI0009782529|nr:hypothetical protein [Lactiplantibacillus plantarum]